VCRPSSLDITSFENVSPGIKPLFFNQNIAQNEPEKNIPSTHAKATSLTANLWSAFIYFKAHSAFFFIDVKFSIALNNLFFSSSSLI